MLFRYYIDTSIWIDFYENRKGFNGEPLGDYALKLFALIKAKQQILSVSALLIRELESYYSIAEIKGMLNPFNKIQRINLDTRQKNEARIIAKRRGLPPGDALHAILARDNNLILVTRDKHFKKLKDIVQSFKPEELI